MAIEISHALVEYILLGSGDSRRQLQDSPILGDVWIRYAEAPAAAADLLITSHKDTTARDLARAIYDGVNDRPDSADDDPAIAPLQGFVAARLYFDELWSDTTHSLVALLADNDKVVIVEEGVPHAIDLLGER